MPTRARRSTAPQVRKATKGASGGTSQPAVKTRRRGEIRVVTKARPPAQSGNSQFAPPGRYDLADAFVKPLAQAFRLAMFGLAGQITAEAVRSAYAAPDDLGLLGPLVDSVFAPPVTKSSIDDLVVTKQDETEISITARLDLHSPYMQRAARQHGADLVTRVNQDTKRAIAKLIARAQRDSIAPEQAAKSIRRLVGLTPQQAIAVENLRGGLERRRDGRMTQAQYERQWSLGPKVPKRSRLTADDIDRLADQYADRLLNYRSLNIARSETIRSSSQGQLATWEAMMRRGSLAANAEMTWMTASDLRVCPVCAPLNGATIRVKAGRFQGTVGKERVEFAGPPAHPSCRCTLVLKKGTPLRIPDEPEEPAAEAEAKSLAETAVEIGERIEARFQANRERFIASMARRFGEKPGATVTIPESYQVMVTAAYDTVGYVEPRRGPLVTFTEALAGIAPEQHTVAGVLGGSLVATGIILLSTAESAVEAAESSGRWLLYLLGGEKPVEPVFIPPPETGLGGLAALAAASLPFFLAEMFATFTAVALRALRAWIRELATGARVAVPAILSDWWTSLSHAQREWFQRINMPSLPKAEVGVLLHHLRNEATERLEVSRRVFGDVADMIHAPKGFPSQVPFFRPEFLRAMRDVALGRMTPTRLVELSPPGLFGGNVGRIVARMEWFAGLPRSAQDDIIEGVMGLSEIEFFAFLRWWENREVEADVGAVVAELRRRRGA